MAAGPGDPQPQGAAQASPEAASPASQAASSPEQAAIQEQLKAFLKAYNVPDIEALARLFVDDAILVDPSGAETRGKQAIAAMYAGEFERAPGVKLEGRIEEVRFLMPEVARVEGLSRLSSSTGDATEFNRFSALAVRREGKWLIAELREYSAPAGAITPHEHLKQLEWMVGDWVDESDHVKVSASVRWDHDQNFLIRNYTVEIAGEKASSGIMIIGWDPQIVQIKSWVFSSEGGHGEGLWTRTAENQWIVKAHGMLHNGLPNSATQVHTVINKDAVKTSSIDRIIGGQVAPDIADVVMVRRPQRPQAHPAAAGTPPR